MPDLLTKNSKNRHNNLSCKWGEKSQISRYFQ